MLYEVITLKNKYQVRSVVLRAPARPLTAGSLQIQAKTLSGNIITAVGDTLGNIAGDGITGTLSHSNGVALA